MRHGLSTVLCVAAGCVGASVAATPAVAADLCVGAEAGCFASIQAAVDVASDGDTISVGPGTYAGGIAIPKSVRLIGAGSGATTITGGGPVMTIGESVGGPGPTVSISRVTIAGGVNDSSPGPAFAAGGGIRIAFGATVTVADSVITRNRAVPKATFTQPAPCGPVPFDECAFAVGGGIDNSGTLTVTDTRISDNLAGSAGVTSYAGGGGINNHPSGTLTLRHSVVTGNRVAVSAPNGRNTDGGGIVSLGLLTIEDSVISSNTSEVDAAVASVFPVNVAEANGGGLYLAGASSTTITGSMIAGNTVLGSNTAGDIEAESGGIDSDGSLDLTDSGVEGNTVTASVPAASGLLAEADGGGLQVQGVTRLRRSRVIGNSLSAISETGTALGSGGGLFNLGGSLTLERSVVTANSASAGGAGGVNLGGGIGNIQFGGPVPELTLTDTVVAANRLEASGGIVAQGGGLYTADFFSGAPFPVTLARAVIHGNAPDQCVGC